MSAKDTRQYLAELRKRGYRTELPRSGHWHIILGGRLVAVTSCTPHGGKRSLDNLKATIGRFERRQAA
jgi:hypothetical protein